jgi:hypothetical protein
MKPSGAAQHSWSIIALQMREKLIGSSELAAVCPSPCLKTSARFTFSGTGFQSGRCPLPIILLPFIFVSTNLCLPIYQVVFWLEKVVYVLPTS